MMCRCVQIATKPCAFCYECTHEMLQEFWTCECLFRFPMLHMCVHNATNTCLFWYLCISKMLQRLWALLQKFAWMLQRFLWCATKIFLLCCNSFFLHFLLDFAKNNIFFAHQWEKLHNHFLLHMLRIFLHVVKSSWKMLQWLQYYSFCCMG
jgi:hypothetical protein